MSHPTIRTYTCIQGDTLSKLAAAHGLHGWRTIYDHPENAELRRRRPNPNVLLPGDPIFIPEKQERQHVGRTETVHRLTVHRAGTRLRIKLVGADYEPLTSTAWKLTIGTNDYAGSTSHDGIVDVALAADAVDGHLTLPAWNHTWHLVIGYLDPLVDGATGALVASGLQARLDNLGYPLGPADGTIERATASEVLRFQETVMHRARPDGVADRDTLAAIERAHGC